MKISVEQLKQLNKEEYILIDIRDAEEAFKNPIENSVVLSGKSVLSKEFDSTKKIIVVCAQGYVIDFVAQRLQEKGYDPINQMIGYILSGDSSYITSHKDARTVIRKYERDELLEEILKSYLSK